MNNTTNNVPEENRKKSFMKRGVTLGLCAVLAGGVAAAGFEGLKPLTAQEVSGAVNKGPMDITDVVDEVMPSVVSITTKTIQEIQNYFSDPGFSFFWDYGFGGYGDRGGEFQPETREVLGGGSGIIIGKNDDELLVVTNYHVVEGASTITAAFIDDEVYEGVVKGYDSDMDIAVIAIPLDSISDKTLSVIKPARIGSSDDLKIGEQVAVIGNAMGYGQSVTTGIVSALNRKIEASPFVSGEPDEKDVNLIQTDAAINPGNSGGAMVNMDGEVVGIASEKLANYLIEGMCYAISISDVESTLADLSTQKTRATRYEDNEHGVLGIVGTTITEQESMKFGWPEGVYVVEVTKDGPADKAGIEENSIITRIDGKKLHTIQDLIDALSFYTPGEEVELTVMVFDNKEKDFNDESVTVTLGEQENNDGKEDSKEEEASEEDSKEEDSKEEKTDEEKEDSREEEKELDRKEIFDSWDNSFVEKAG